MVSKPPSSWWGRHWKWVVPVGCLTAVAGTLAFIALIVAFVFGLIRGSTPYRQALARAQADPLVISRLGAPINGGFFVSGSVRLSGDEGQAKLAIPLQGSRGSGTLLVRAHQTNGRWTYSQLMLQPDGSGGSISLLQPTL